MNQFIKILLCATLTLSTIQTLMASGQGDVVPDCPLISTDNVAHNLKQFQGKVLYVDFWASWCGPCAKSFPFLNQLDHDLKDRGLQIIGINLDENTDDAQAFVAKYPAYFMIATGNNQQCATDFGVKGMPSSYLIDRTGHIRYSHQGFRAGEAEELKILVEQLLAEH